MRTLVRCGGRLSAKSTCMDDPTEPAAKERSGGKRIPKRVDGRTRMSIEAAYWRGGLWDRAATMSHSEEAGARGGGWRPCRAPLNDVRAIE